MQSPVKESPSLKERTVESDSQVGPSIPVVVVTSDHAMSFTDIQNPQSSIVDSVTQQLNEEIKNRIHNLHISSKSNFQDIQERSSTDDIGLLNADSRNSSTLIIVMGKSLEKNVQQQLSDKEAQVTERTNGETAATSVDRIDDSRSSNNESIPSDFHYVSEADRDKNTTNDLLIKKHYSESCKDNDVQVNQKLELQPDSLINEGVVQADQKTCLHSENNFHAKESISTNSCSKTETGNNEQVCNKKLRFMSLQLSSKESFTKNGHESNESVVQQPHNYDGYLLKEVDKFKTLPQNNSNKLESKASNSFLNGSSVPKEESNLNKPMSAPLISNINESNLGSTIFCETSCLPDGEQADNLNTNELRNAKPEPKVLEDLLSKEERSRSTIFDNDVLQQDIIKETISQNNKPNVLENDIKRYKVPSLKVTSHSSTVLGNVEDQPQVGEGSELESNLDTSEIDTANVKRDVLVIWSSPLNVNKDVTALGTTSNGPGYTNVNQGLLNDVNDTDRTSQTREVDRSSSSDPVEHSGIVLSKDGLIERQEKPHVISTEKPLHVSENNVKSNMNDETIRPLVSYSENHIILNLDPTLIDDKKPKTENMHVISLQERKVDSSLINNEETAEEPELILSPSSSAVFEEVWKAIIKSKVERQGSKLLKRGSNADVSTLNETNSVPEDFDLLPLGKTGIITTEPQFETKSISMVLNDKSLDQVEVQLESNKMLLSLEHNQLASNSIKDSTSQHDKLIVESPASTSKHQSEVTININVAELIERRSIDVITTRNSSKAGYEPLVDNDELNTSLKRIDVTTSTSGNTLPIVTDRNIENSYLLRRLEQVEAILKIVCDGNMTPGQLDVTSTHPDLVTAPNREQLPASEKSNISFEETRIEKHNSISVQFKLNKEELTLSDHQGYNADVCIEKQTDSSAESSYVNQALEIIDVILLQAQNDRALKNKSSRTEPKHKDSYQVNYKEVKKFTRKSGYYDFNKSEDENEKNEDIKLIHNSNDVNEKEIVLIEVDCHGGSTNSDFSQRTETQTTKHIDTINKLSSVPDNEFIDNKSIDLSQHSDEKFNESESKERDTVDSLEYQCDSDIVSNNITTIDNETNHKNKQLLKTGSNDLQFYKSYDTYKEDHKKITVSDITSKHQDDNNTKVISDSDIKNINEKETLNEGFGKFGSKSSSNFSKLLVENQETHTSEELDYSENNNSNKRRIDREISVKVVKATENSDQNKVSEKQSNSSLEEYALKTNKKYQDGRINAYPHDHVPFMATDSKYQDNEYKKFNCNKNQFKTNLKQKSAVSVRVDSFDNLRKEFQAKYQEYRNNKIKQNSCSQETYRDADVYCSHNSSCVEVDGYTSSETKQDSSEDSSNDFHTADSGSQCDACHCYDEFNDLKKRSMVDTKCLRSDEFLTSKDSSEDDTSKTGNKCDRKTVLDDDNAVRIKMNSRDLKEDSNESNKSESGSSDIVSQCGANQKPYHYDSKLPQSGRQVDQQTRSDVNDVRKRCCLRKDSVTNNSDRKAQTITSEVNVLKADLAQTTIKLECCYELLCLQISLNKCYKDELESIDKRVKEYCSHLLASGSINDSTNIRIKCKCRCTQATTSAPDRLPTTDAHSANCEEQDEEEDDDDDAIYLLFMNFDSQDSSLLNNYEGEDNETSDP